MSERDIFWDIHRVKSLREQELAANLLKMPETLQPDIKPLSDDEFNLDILKDLNA